MTVVLAVLTDEFAVIATDRRITWSKKSADGEIEQGLQDDTDTKSIVVNQRYLMGFAGLGRYFEPSHTEDGYSGHRMDLWAVDQMNPSAPDQYFDDLAKGMGSLCERVGYTGRHGFLAVGFEGDDNLPVLIGIKNDVFPHSFDVSTEHLDGTPYLIRFIGGKIPDEVLDGLHRHVRYLQRWNPANPVSLHRQLVNAIRATAPTSNGHVGEIVTVTSLPRKAVPTLTGVPMTHQPNREAFEHMEMSWTYDPAGTKVVNLPARVGAGLRMVSGFMSSEPLGDPRLDRDGYYFHEFSSRST